MGVVVALSAPVCQVEELWNGKGEQRERKRERERATARGAVIHRANLSPFVVTHPTDKSFLSVFSLLLPILCSIVFSLTCKQVLPCFDKEEPRFEVSFRFLTCNPTSKRKILFDNIFYYVNVILSE